VASAEYKVVQKIKDPEHNHKRIETNHNFLKRVRSAIKIIKYFDDFHLQYQNVDIAVMNELFDRYGEISDKIAKLELLEKSGISWIIILVPYLVRFV
jgi:hypothetical protein